jgi:type IV fimbrial biogenesis protein FimT
MSVDQRRHFVHYRSPGRLAGAGFTLVELMITVAVFAIVAAIAAPAMQSMVAASRLNGATGEMVTALQLARSEAIRRNTRVTVCASANGTACSGSGDWSRWIVTDGGAVPIRDQSANADLRLSGPGAGIIFNPSGLIRAEQGLTVCSPTTKVTDNRRVITILISGVVSYARSGSAGVCS